MPDSVTDWPRLLVAKATMCIVWRTDAVLEPYGDCEFCRE